MEVLENDNKTAAVDWYRSPVDSEAIRALYERNDLLAWMQTLGYALTILTTGSLAFYSSRHWGFALTILFVILHGICFAFMINAVHELNHGTVFKSKALNSFFADLFAFLGWINHKTFDASHIRHHRSTLHPPDDLEVVVPIEITVKDFLKNAFISPSGFLNAAKFHIRIARARFEGDWELKLFPVAAVEKRAAAVRWARLILIGQAGIFLIAILFKLWMLLVLITFAPFYCGVLFFFCNNTQHVGLQDYATDFRLCARTFVSNPVIEFLYWHMNYHIEHHMYVGVPCYNLHKLHRLIEADLPPSKGVIGTWLEIHAILARQHDEPGYIYTPKIPCGEDGRVTGLPASS